MFLLGSVLLNSVFLGGHPLHQSFKVLRVVLSILLLLFSVASVVLFFFSFRSTCAFLKNESSFQTWRLCFVDLFFCMFLYFVNLFSLNFLPSVSVGLWFILDLSSILSLTFFWRHLILFPSKNCIPWVWCEKLRWWNHLISIIFSPLTLKLITSVIKFPSEWIFLIIVLALFSNLIALW